MGTALRVLIDVREVLVGAADRVPLGFLVSCRILKILVLAGFTALLEQRLDALVEVVAGHVVVDDAEALDEDGVARGGLVRCVLGFIVTILGVGIIISALTNLILGIGCRFESTNFSGTWLVTIDLGSGDTPLFIKVARGRTQSLGKTCIQVGLAQEAAAACGPVIQVHGNRAH